MARIGANAPGGGGRQNMHPPQWLPPPPPPDSSCDTNRDDLSSQDSSSYRAIPSYWRRQGGSHQHQHGSQPSDGLASPVYQSPLPEEQRLYYEPAPQILGPVQQSNSLPLGPAHSPSLIGGGSAPSPPLPPGLHGCGGHCIAFESFCHYCLQVSFVFGILTGLSLCIAGGVLRGGRGGGGDLLVLVYIGALAALVSALLLSVQCCVRRQVEARKRALARPRGIIGNPSQHIQMSTLQRTVAAPNSVMGGPAAPQLQPLLARLVQQQSREPLLVQQQQQNLQNWERGDMLHNTVPRGGVMHNHNSMTLVNCHRGSDCYRSQVPMEDHNGVPWWRRDGLNESRH